MQRLVILINMYNKMRSDLLKGQGESQRTNSFSKRGYNIDYAVMCLLKILGMSLTISGLITFTELLCYKMCSYL